MTADRDVEEEVPAGPSVKEPTEDEIDLNLIGSFPASDPPSWTLGVTRDDNASTGQSDAGE